MLSPVALSEIHYRISDCAYHRALELCQHRTSAGNQVLLPASPEAAERAAAELETVAAFTNSSRDRLSCIRCAAALRAGVFAWHLI
jgi:hypothetical protein